MLTKAQELLRVLEGRPWQYCRLDGGAALEPGKRGVSLYSVVEGDRHIAA